MFSTRNVMGIALASLLTTGVVSPAFAGFAMPAPETTAEGGSNWYLGAMTGFVSPRHFQVTNSNNGHVYHPKFKSNYDLGLLFGYRASTFRFEGQFLFVESALKRMRNGNTGVETTPPAIDFYGGATALRARLKSEFLLANMYYDFNGQSDTWGYYLGLGAGMGRFQAYGTTADGVSGVNGYSSQTVLKASESKIAYQGMFGVTYSPDSSRFVYDLGLRYLTTGKLNKVSSVAAQYPMLNLSVTYQVPN